MVNSMARLDQLTRSMISRYALIILILIMIQIYHTWLGHLVSIWVTNNVISDMQENVVKFFS